MGKKKKLEAKDRFKTLSEDELLQIKTKIKNPNIEKANKKAEHTFVEYLSTRPDIENTFFWLYKPEKLDSILAKFGFEVKMTDGENYRVSSLKHLMYGLNRVLKKKGHEYDIMKSTQFMKSQEAFQQAIVNLKQMGYRYVVPYKEIKPKGK